MKLPSYIIIALLLSVQTKAQIDTSSYVGTYGDWMADSEALTTQLDLNADGTFKLRAVDHVYPQTFKYFTNKGIWVVKNDEIVLNPNLEKRKPSVKVTERKTGAKDSITIKVNHFNEHYENQILIEKKKAEFDIVTLYFNKKRKYKHLTREGYTTGSCAWAPKIRNRVNLDSTNTFKIPKIGVDKIGVFTYGFTEFLEIFSESKDSDYYEINITVPIDIERMPRSKKVIIKGSKAYFHEIKGKVRKSLRPLLKKD